MTNATNTNNGIQEVKVTQGRDVFLTYYTSESEFIADHGTYYFNGCVAFYCVAHDGGEKSFSPDDFGSARKARAASLAYLKEILNRTTEGHTMTSTIEDRDTAARHLDAVEISEDSGATVYQGGSRWPTLEEIREDNKARHQRQLASYRAVATNADR